MRASSAAIAVLLIAGCGGEGRETCREPGEQIPEQTISVGDAREREGELVKIEGALIARKGKPERLCASLGDAWPPECKGESLDVEGLRDLSGFEGGNRRGEWTSIESAHVGGRIDGETLRIALSCRTQHVQDHFEDETGEKLTFNAFGSVGDVERLDLAPVPELMPADARREYGWFSIGVRTTATGGPVYSDTLRRATYRGPEGVFWVQEDRNWVAIKRYGDDVGLIWLAGKSRRLDERWERLDEVMSDLDSPLDG